VGGGNVGVSVGRIGVSVGGAGVGVSVAVGAMDTAFETGRGVKVGLGVLVGGGVGALGTLDPPREHAAERLKVRATIRKAMSFTRNTRAECDVSTMDS